MSLVRDPVCGMSVDPGNGLLAEYQGQAYFFCSEFCRSTFLAPGRLEPDFTRPLPARAEVVIEGRTVALCAWRYDVVGSSGHVVPLLLLDTDLEQNAGPDRRLTDSLYDGDERYRLSQEIVLGIGGVRMLKQLGYTSVEKFHMNEGHASLLALELLRGEPDRNAVAHDIDDVKKRCVFTTHTPVPAGHDKFLHRAAEELRGGDLAVACLEDYDMDLACGRSKHPERRA